MTGLVVDASVAAKWFFEEEGRGAALSLLEAAGNLCAPELLFAELASVCLKKVRRGEAEVDEAAAVIERLKRLPLEPASCIEYVVGAFRIAHGSGVSAYDALYVAVAEARDRQVVTADRKLVQAVAGTPWEGRVVGLGDLPAG